MILIHVYIHNHLTIVIIDSIEESKITYFLMNLLLPLKYFISTNNTIPMLMPHQHHYYTNNQKKTTTNNKKKKHGTLIKFQF